jgi:pantetheine-phosphate adenylyltransferase
MSSSASSAIAVYTGSFDPVTLGHLHIIERAAKLYERLIVGVGINSGKEPLFEPVERVGLLKRVTGHCGNVEIELFDGLAVDYVRQRGSRVMVRGIRPLTDIAGEFTMMMANRQLDAGIETVFLMADEEYVHVSSSLIKQIAMLGGARHLDRFIPEEIIPDVVARFMSRQEKLSG